MEHSSLHQSFINALPDRLSGLEQAYERYKEIGPSELEEFYRLTHNLAGASAMYGFDQISEPCRDLERYLRALMVDEVVINVDVQAEVRKMLDAIRGSVDKVITNEVS